MNCTTLAQILGPALIAVISGPRCLAQSEIHAFVGDPTQGGEVRSFREGTGSPLAPPPEALGINLLPVDFNARLNGDQLLPEAAKYHRDLAGAGRIELPSRRGMLYRFRRSVAGMGTSFGFLHVDGSGNMRALAERPGAGPQADQDPYLARVALSPSGDRFLAMTTVAADGNLIDVTISNGQLLDRTAGLPALDFRPQSARLNSDWCLAVADQGVYRCRFSASDQMAPVTLGGAPAYYSGEVVLSEDRSQALLTAGASAAMLHAWVVSTTGEGRRASRSPGPMSGAGYMPEALHGPFLAVANDGVLCAWRMESPISREVFARRSTAPANQTATHITGTQFNDTLDEAGVLNMAQVGSLVMAVGEVGTDPGVGIEKADFFEVTLDAQGASTIRNITQTSGQVAPPFISIPALSPGFMRWLPSTQSFVVWDEQSGGTGRLLELDLAGSGVRVLRNDVKEVFFMEQVGSSLLVSIRLATGDKPHQLIRFPLNLATPPSVLLDTGDSMLLDSVADGAGWLAFKEVPEFGLQRLWMLNEQTTTFTSFPLLVDRFGPVLAWARGGDLALSFDRNDMRYFAAWPRTSAPYRLRAVDTLGAILPGR